MSYRTSRRAARKVPRRWLPVAVAATVLAPVATVVVAGAPAGAALSPSAPIQVLPVGPNGLRDLAVASDGTTYFTDVAYGQIGVITPGGLPGADIVLQGGNHIDGIAVDAAKDVFVTDATQGLVIKHQPNGTETTLAFTGLSNPQAVALDAAGDVFVADTGNDRIVELPHAGSQITVDTSALGTPLSAPRGITVDGDGTLVIADTGNDRVVQVPSGGPATVVTGLTGLSTPTDVAVDSAGTIFVSDTDHDRVEELPVGGTHADAPFTGLDAPGGLAVDRSDRVVVADTNHARILRLPSVDTVGFSALTGPYGVATDAAGDRFVVDNVADKVYELPHGGGAQVTLGFSALDNPLGIAVSSLGDVYVTDAGHHRIVELPHGGGAEVDLTPSGLDTPYGIAVNSAGDLFVADTVTNDVLELPHGGGQTWMGFTGLSGPRGVAVHGTDVYVTDTGHDAIVKMTGGVQSTVTTGTLLQPRGVMVDSAGDLFVADTGGHRVVEVPNGGTARPLALGVLNAPIGLALDPSGNLLVADTAARVVLELPAAPTAVAIDTLALGGTGALAVAPGGALLVADAAHDRVEQVPAGGGTPTVLGLSGLSDPEAVAANSTDTYVADTGHNAIERLHGVTQSTVAGLPSLSGPKGVAVAANGDLYVADTGHDRVIELPHGGSQTTVGFSGLNQPTGLALTASGDLYVLDSGNGRIVELPHGGTQTTITVPGIGDLSAFAVDAAGDVYAADTSFSHRAVTVLYHGGGSADLNFGGLVGPTAVAVDAGGNTFVLDASRGVEEIGPFTLPSAPTIIGVHPASGHITVNWVAPASDGGTAITGYRVTPSSSGSPLVPVEFPAGTTSGDITGLSNGTTYTFTVAAQNAVGFGPESAASSGSTPFDTPSAPQGITAVPSDGQVAVSWTAPLSDGGFPITGYTVVPHKGATALDPISVDASTLSTVITGLTNGATYTFSVSARNTFGSGTVATSGPVVPAAPATAPKVVSVVGGNHVATLTWAAPTSTGGSPVTSYTIQPSIGHLALAPIATGSSATSRVMTGLTNGVAYRFTVAANNAASPGPASAVSPAVVPPFSSTGNFVRQQVADISGRTATSADLVNEIAALNDGSSPGAYVALLRRSPDAVSHVDPMARLYLAYFRRIPDVSGLRYWIGKLRTGTTISHVSSVFAASSEFKAAYGSLSNSQFVTLVYHNVLGRSPDAGGAAYWLKKLNTGAKTRGQVMLAFSESHEFVTASARTIDVAVTWELLLRATPTSGDVSTWVTALTTGGKTIDDLATALMGTASYLARLP